MRLSSDKVNKLAHVVSDALADMTEVDFLEDRNTVRLETRKILEGLLNQEARIDQMARQKIESQKNDDPRRQPGVGHPLPQVLQRGSEETGNLKAGVSRRSSGKNNRIERGGFWPPLFACTQSGSSFVRRTDGGVCPYVGRGVGRGVCGGPVNAPITCQVRRSAWSGRRRLDLCDRRRGHAFRGRRGARCGASHRRRRWLRRLLCHCCRRLRGP